VATATSILILADRGKIDLDAPAAEYIPEFAQNGKEEITIAQLLTHQGGLIPDNPLSDYGAGPEKAWESIFALQPRVTPGSRFVYTDVGFLVLGEVVHRTSDQDLNEFTRENLFGPLGMRATGYLPSRQLAVGAAATERRDGRWMVGEVHDPRAHALGGIAGHAGLFSTAEDLAVYAQMMLGRGEYGGARIFSEQTWKKMTTPVAVSSGRRGLGWDMRTGYSSNRGKGFSESAFGHGGFTGTSLWIDPGRDLFVIFLSSRLHPDGKGSINPIAGQVGTIAVEAIEER
jgi:CubicO group peptidase (beta-lactamase class C family)